MATTCNDVIAKCDAALAAKDEQIRLSDLALKQSMEFSGNLAVVAQDRERQLNAWYRNPFIMLILGAAVGGLVYGVATK